MHSKLGRICLILAAVAVGGLLTGFLLLGAEAGREDWDWGFEGGRYTVNDEKNFIARDIGAVEVGFSSGNIVVQATEGDRIMVRLRGRTSQRWNRPELRTDLTGRRLSINVGARNRLFFGFHINRLTLEVSLPRELAADLAVHGSSGNIDVEGIKAGEFRADLSSGRLRAVGIRAERTVLHGSSGSITADGDLGDLEARMSSGKLAISYTAFHAYQVKGRVSSGHLDLDLPDDAGFTLQGGVSSGRVSCDFPLTMTGRNDRRSLAGTVNGGGSRVELSASSGEIRVF